jgi:hypothetical protein
MSQESKAEKEYGFKHTTEDLAKNPLKDREDYKDRSLNNAMSAFGKEIFLGLLGGSDYEDGCQAALDKAAENLPEN